MDDPDTLLRLVVGATMVLCYAREERSRWYILAFAAACALGAACEFIEGALAFGAIGAIWAIAAVWRFWGRMIVETPPPTPWSA